jgi:hypothetical protein
MHLQAITLQGRLFLDDPSSGPDVGSMLFYNSWMFDTQHFEAVVTNQTRLNKSANYSRRFWKPVYFEEPIQIFAYSDDPCHRYGQLSGNREGSSSRLFPSLDPTNKYVPSKYYGL